MTTRKRRERVLATGWADVGSHGGVFEFISGPVADRYPNLLHIYTKQHRPDLIQVKIVEVKTARKGKK